MPNLYQNRHRECLQAGQDCVDQGGAAGRAAAADSQQTVRAAAAQEEEEKEKEENQGQMCPEEGTESHSDTRDSSR